MQLGGDQAPPHRMFLCLTRSLLPSCFPQTHLPVARGLVKLSEAVLPAKQATLEVK